MPFWFPIDPIREMTCSTLYFHIDLKNSYHRMQWLGQGGAIQVKHTMYRLIKAGFVCEPYGTVNIKGKGEMEV